MSANVMWVLATLVAVVVLPACDPIFTVCGKVTQCSDGKPLVGVEVSISTSKDRPPDIHAFTDPTGGFCGRDVGGTADRIFVHFEKPGFVSSDVEVSHSTMTVPDTCLTSSN